MTNQPDTFRSRYQFFTVWGVGIFCEGRLIFEHENMLRNVWAKVRKKHNIKCVSSLDLKTIIYAVFYIMFYSCFLLFFKYCFYLFRVKTIMFQYIECQHLKKHKRAVAYYVWVGIMFLKERKTVFNVFGTR